MNIVIMSIIVATAAIGFTRANPGLVLMMMIIFLSIGLLFNGIASIISGITGNPRLSPIPK